MAHKTTRLLVSIFLLLFTVLWLGVWLFGWITEDGALAEQGFYPFWVFFAATLVYFGVRASIYE